MNGSLVWGLIGGLNFGAAVAHFSAGSIGPGLFDMSMSALALLIGWDDK